MVIGVGFFNLFCEALHTARLHIGFLPAPPERGQAANINASEICVIGSRVTQVCQQLVPILVK